MPPQRGTGTVYRVSPDACVLLYDSGRFGRRQGIEDYEIQHVARRRDLQPADACSKVFRQPLTLDGAGLEAVLRREVEEAHLARQRLGIQGNSRIVLTPSRSAPHFP